MKKQNIIRLKYMMTTSFYNTTIDYKEESTCKLDLIATLQQIGGFVFC